MKYYSVNIEIPHKKYDCIVLANYEYEALQILLNNIIESLETEKYEHTFNPNKESYYKEYLSHIDNDYQELDIKEYVLKSLKFNSIIKSFTKGVLNNKIIELENEQETFI